MENYADLMFTEATRALQQEQGSFERYQKLYPHRTQKALSKDDVDFVKSSNSFYLATVSATGWPYIQHRGGTRGFVSILGPKTLACADYPGNMQFISMGNLKTDNRVSMFFMDYMNRGRLKIQGRAQLIPSSEADPELLKQLDQTAAQAERVLIVEIVAMDWNCPKHIPELYPKEVIQHVVSTKIAELRSENAALRSELEKARSQISSGK